MNITNHKICDKDNFVKITVFLLWFKNKTFCGSHKLVIFSMDFRHCGDTSDVTNGDLWWPSWLKMSLGRFRGKSRKMFKISTSKSSCLKSNNIMSRKIQISSDIYPNNKSMYWLVSHAIQVVIIIVFCVY